MRDRELDILHKPRKLEVRLLRKITKLNRAYNLIRPGDRILVGVSGGKDSLSLARLLWELKKRLPFPIEVHAISLDPGFPGFDFSRVSEWMAEQGIPYEVVETNIAETVNRVVEPGKMPCSACARFRRGILYDIAHERRMVLALGHHADDAMETLLLNIFYTGKLQAMPPVLVSDDGRNRLIRPLLYAREAELEAYARHTGAPIVDGDCPWKSYLLNSKRETMSRILHEMEEENPDLARHMLRAMANIKPTNLMDPRFHDFSSLRASWETAEGDGTDDDPDGGVGLDR